MTAIFATVDGIHETVALRNFLEFDVSYTEITKTFQNESGQTIVYPVRTGKRKISLKIEANTAYLKVLRTLFSAAVVHLQYTDGMYSDTDSMGNIKQETLEGDFRKTSDLTITRKADACTALPNAGMYSPYGKQGLYDRCGRGAYEFAVSLEEV